MENVCKLFLNMFNVFTLINYVNIIIKLNGDNRLCHVLCRIECESHHNKGR